MSPEQLQGHEADARSDIFSLGCVLYEMLTGKGAFDGKSQVSIMAAILEHEPTPISEVQPLTPGWLDRVIRRCLRKSPEQRWQSAGDIAIELREPHEAVEASAPFARKAIWPPSYTFDIRGPEGAPVYGRGASISPDGRSITYMAVHEGRPKL